MAIKQWKKIATEESYQCGKFYRVDKDKVLTPGGKEGTYYVIRRPSESIVVVPVDRDGFFYLTRQHRYPINDFSLEFPSGYIDEGEDEAQAAKRELLEEMQLISEQWEKVGKIHYMPGVIDGSALAFLALEVISTQEKSTDPIDENLHETIKVSYQDLKKMIAQSDITSAATLSALRLAEESEGFKNFFGR